MPTSWEYVPPSTTESGASTQKYQVKSQVTRIEKGRNPNSNTKTDRVRKVNSTRVSSNGGKKRPITATSTCLGSPVHLGEDPKIEIKDRPIFSPPTKIPRTDPEYVVSFGASARSVETNIIEEERESPESVSLQIEMETVLCTEMLQTILSNMTQLHAIEEPGQAVFNYATTMPLPECDPETEMNQIETETQNEKQNEEIPSEETNSETVQREEREQGTEEERSKSGQGEMIIIETEKKPVEDDMLTKERREKLEQLKKLQEDLESGNELNIDTSKSGQNNGADIAEREEEPEEEERVKKEKRKQRKEEKTKRNACKRSR